MSADRSPATALLDAASAAALLTAVPLPRRLYRLPSAATTAAFGLVGLALGGLVGAVDTGLAPVLAPLPRAALAVAFLALLSGGLHLDGLADTVDGLAARGPRQRRLEAMRDSRVGAVGAAAVAVVVALEVAALAALGSQRLAALVVAGGCSRTAGAIALAAAPPAQPDGLGHLFAVAHVRPAALAALATVAACGVGLYGWRGLVAAGVAAGVGAATAIGLRRAVGGITGDGCGAAVELAFAAALLSLGARG